MKLLQLLRPVMLAIPEVAQPDRPVQFQEKASWTFVSVLVFLICSQLPLYGARDTLNVDPFYRLRTMLGSTHGSLMELGVFPVLISGLLMQVLASSKALQINMGSKEERALFTGAQKILALAITTIGAIGFVLAGFYGSIAEIGITNAALIVLQLVFAGLLVIVLDEMLQKGYGFGSAVSLFTACNVCQAFVLAAVSPLTIDRGNGKEFYGALIAFFHLLIVRSNKLAALYEGLFRTHLPNVWNLFATVLVFAITVLLQTFRIDVPVYSPKARGGQGNYPIRLLYTSNMPAILFGSAVSSVYFISQMLFARFGSNFLVRFFGVWEEVDGKLIPTGGMAHYISPPNTVLDLITDPFHTLFYLVFVLSACAIFSQMWVEISGISAANVARNLRDQQIGVKGHRDNSIASVLNRYIPIAAQLGGVLIGVITVLADFTGAIGSGTGVLLAVTIIYQYYEMFAREAAAAGMLPGLLGM